MDDEKKQNILDHLKKLNPRRQKKIKINTSICNILIVIMGNVFTVSNDNEAVFNSIR